jgi:hypothetical protein
LSDGDDHGIEDIDKERAAREVSPDDDDPDERKKAFAITVAATGCRLLLTNWTPPLPHALSTASRYIAYFFLKQLSSVKLTMFAHTVGRGSGCSYLILFIFKSFLF